jgi:nucleotide-binding universal stress UspA family protein
MTREFAVQRILVALDDSPYSRAALQAAVELAHLLEAEVIGVFVEDINLLRLSQLPFAREVRLHSATLGRLTRAQMERYLRLQAAQARRALQQAAEAQQLTYSFRVVRGPVSAEVLSASLDADLLALGRVSRPVRTRRLGSTARTAVAESKRPLLLIGDEAPLDRPVMALYDGSDGAARALTVAAYLAQSSGQLRVVVWGETEAELRQREQDAAARLQNSNLEIITRRLRQASSANLAYLLRLSNVGLLVFSDADSPLPLNELIEDLDYPALLVR